MKKTNIVYVAIVLSLLSGCSLTPEYSRPAIDMPSEWSAQSASQQTIMAKNWWTSFNNEELNALMTKALSYNNDLGAAVARVEQSRALARSSGASLLPSLDGTGGINYNRVDPPEGKAQDSLRNGDRLIVR